MITAGGQFVSFVMAETGVARAQAHANRQGARARARDLAMDGAELAAYGLRWPSQEDGWTYIVLGLADTVDRRSRPT